MSLPLVRAVCLATATVLAGTPVLAATCELACSHSSTTNHHSGSPASHHHAAATHVRSDGASATLNAVYEHDCCREAAVTASATIAGRVDAKVFVAAYSLAPASPAFFQANQVSSAAPIRGAPPGHSSSSVRALPLRI